MATHSSICHGKSHGQRRLWGPWGHKESDMTKQLTHCLFQLLDPKYVYGIKGIAQLFGCSISTAQRIKNSGVIDPAIRQRNRRIIVETQTAIRLFDDPNLAKPVFHEQLVEMVKELLKPVSTVRSKEKELFKRTSPKAAIFGYVGA